MHTRNKRGGKSRTGTCNGLDIVSATQANGSRNGPVSGATPQSPHSARFCNMFLHSLAAPTMGPEPWHWTSTVGSADGFAHAQRHQKQRYPTQHLNRQAHPLVTNQVRQAAPARVPARQTPARALSDTPAPEAPSTHSPTHAAPPRPDMPSDIRRFNRALASLDALELHPILRQKASFFQQPPRFLRGRVRQAYPSFMFRLCLHPPSQHSNRDHAGMEALLALAASSPPMQARPAPPAQTRVETPCRTISGRRMAMNGPPCFAHLHWLVKTRARHRPPPD